MPPQTRERRHESRYEGVRKVKGKCAYQCRYWLGGSRFAYVQLNLGLFTQSVWGEDAEWAAGRAWLKFDRLWVADPTTRRWPTPWAIVKELQRRGIVPRDLLPMWVRRADGGFIAVSGRGKGAFRLGPFPDPETAHAAMAKALGRPSIV